jgi:hypothetical protein
MIRDVHPGSDFLPIPDPEARGQKGKEYRIRIRNTDLIRRHLEIDLLQLLLRKAK